MIGSWLLLQIRFRTFVSLFAFRKRMGSLPIKIHHSYFISDFALLDLIPFLSKLEFGKINCLRRNFKWIFRRTLGHQGFYEVRFD